MYVCGAGASPLAQRLFCCVLQYDETAGRQAGQSKQNATRCMDGDTICKQKQGSCVYCCCCFLPAFIASIAILLAGWLRVLLRLAGGQAAELHHSVACLDSFSLHKRIVVET